MVTGSVLFSFLCGLVVLWDDGHFYEGCLWKTLDQKCGPRDVNCSGRSAGLSLNAAAAFTPVWTGRSRNSLTQSVHLSLSLLVPIARDALSPEVSTGHMCSAAKTAAIFDQWSQLPSVKISWCLHRIQQDLRDEVKENTTWHFARFRTRFMSWSFGRRPPATRAEAHCIILSFSCGGDTNCFEMCLHLDFRSCLIPKIEVGALWLMCARGWMRILGGVPPRFALAMQASPRSAIATRVTSITDVGFRPKVFPHRSQKRLDACFCHQLQLTTGTVESTGTYVSVAKDGGPMDEQSVILMLFPVVSSVGFTWYLRTKFRVVCFPCVEGTFMCLGCLRTGCVVRCVRQHCIKMFFCFPNIVECLSSIRHAA